MIGKNCTTIKKQLYLRFKIDKYQSEHVFLVVPFLSSDIILGNDWHLKNGTQINYKEKKNSINNINILNEFVMFEKSAADKIVLAQSNERTFGYLIKKKKK